jgi:hypothetical protein
MSSYLQRLLPSVFSYARPDSFVNQLRARRSTLLTQCLDQLPHTARPARILDLGGTHHFWAMLGIADPGRFHITLLNLEQETLPPGLDGFASVRGTATKLDYGPGDFDFVFSNSVIEHMGSREGQAQMAQEVRRVSTRYLIQTPAFWFPLEPHSHVPGFQFLPHAVRAVLIRHFRINYFPAGQTYAECRRISRSTIMLTGRQFQRLFPGAQLHKERLFGLVKSYTVIGGFGEGP